MWVPSLASWTGWGPRVGTQRWCQVVFIEPDEQWGLFVAGPMPVDGVGRLIVVPKDLMKFEAIKLFLEISYLLAVCHHAGVVTI
jgi:hypothetical protein